MNRHHIGVIAAAMLVSGCATVPERAIDVSAVNELTQREPVVMRKTANEQAEARRAAESLLQAPLSREDAVRLAIRLSPAFQSMLAESAAQTAAATQSARLSNPIFTFERLARREDGAIDLDIGRMLSVALLEWIYLPSRVASANAATSQIAIRQAGSVVDLATNVQQAWVRAVAAEQSLHYFEQVMDAAEASAELAKRMYQVGNFSRLQRAQQQAFYAEAALQLTKAKQHAVATREALVRTLGLDADLAGKLVLPPRLPDLPKSILDEPRAAQMAVDQRLDIQIGRAEIARIGAKAGYEKASSFVNAFHLAAVRNSATGKTPQRGYELELAIPVFDWGDARRAQAQAEYVAATQRLAQTLVDAESNVRESYAAYRAAHTLATHYRDEIVPLRKVIADETLLKYNGMLTSVFELLSVTHTQIGSVILAIDAERDFWLAEAALNANLIGRPVGSVRMEAIPTNAASAAAH